MATPWHGAREHRRRMQQVGHVAALIALVRDRSTGQVRLRRDGSAAIDYRPGAAEVALLRQAIVATARVHLAAGATEVLAIHSRLQRCAAAEGARGLDAFAARVAASAPDRNWSPLFSAHQMGTCRMGTNRRTAVCDERGAVFGVRGLYVADASAFPLASGVNPMLTVMALAHRIASSLAAA
jgi:choline dehydrogenase-like flavoprotein